jgi:superfamily I DNA/RNA helicase
MPEDLARYVHDWGRNCRLNPEQAMARCPVEGLKTTLFRSFVERLERFKRVENLLDFTGMLELVLELGRRPDVDVALIDEAQDLAPLQAAVCEMWFESCERSYVAGDEDQAVYGFQGADPSWLLQLAERGEPEILRKSHRVPIVVHALASQVIRQNKTRLEKDYLPVARAGRVEHADRRDLARYLHADVETFVLARNRIYLRPIAHQLLDLGYPYIVEGDGGPSPLSNERLLRAISVAKLLVAPDAQLFFAKDIKILLDHVPAGSGLTSWETKSRIRELAKEGAKIVLSELVELGMKPLLDNLEQQGPLSILTTRWRRYFELLFERYGCVPQPKIVLTTMHGAKAREADRVILIPDMSRATWNDYQRGGHAGFESENRILYVALTRAKETLVLVSPRGRRHFDLPRVDLVEGTV